MSAFLRSLKLNNFLSFGPESKAVELTPLNVIIGPNASGKSNFIEAIELLHSTPTDLAGPIRFGGTAGEWLWKGHPIPEPAVIEAKLRKTKALPELRYRLAFTDFHPEKALGFLPHELDYTHLRMIWRRWKKKANLSIFGHPLTPFGPAVLDKLISRLFMLKGDLVPDFRLVDYLACLLSTDRSPALNGIMGNTDLLRKDLDEMGVFDEQMSVYLLYKLREFGKMGFSGFEGRHYSLFENFEEDMGRAADLQTLITALSYKYMAQGIDHGQRKDRCPRHP